MPLKPMNKPLTGIAGAAADLGLGDMLQQQAIGETEEMRRKRMREMQQNAGIGSGMAARDLLGSGFGGVGGPAGY